MAGMPSTKQKTTAVLGYRLGSDSPNTDPDLLFVFFPPSMETEADFGEVCTHCDVSRHESNASLSYQGQIQPSTLTN